MATFDVHETDLPNLDHYLALSGLHTPKLIDQRQSRHKTFMKQPGVQLVLQFESIPQFRGFDPMSAEAISDTLIMHQAFLNLAREDSHLFVSNEDIATVIQDQVWFVRQAVLFVSEREDIRFEKGRVEVSLPGISLQWDAEMISDEDGKMVFLCR